MIVLFQVHPRTRGESGGRDSFGVSVRGLSPHARGKHTSPWLRHNLSRFIPARAGKAFNVAACQQNVTVHPRTRGVMP